LILIASKNSEGRIKRGDQVAPPGLISWRCLSGAVGPHEKVTRPLFSRPDGLERAAGTVCSRRCAGTFSNKQRNVNGTLEIHWNQLLV
jgi:hypothetical protein